MRIIEMRDPAGAEAKAYVGFALSVLLVGPFVPLYRGHLVAFIVMIVVILGGGFLIYDNGGEPFDQLYVFACWCVFSCTYNSWHRAWLLGRGYRPATETA